MSVSGGRPHPPAEAGKAYSMRNVLFRPPGPRAGSGRRLALGGGGKERGWCLLAVYTRGILQGTQDGEGNSFIAWGQRPAPQTQLKGMVLIRVCLTYWLLSLAQRAMFSLCLFWCECDFVDGLLHVRVLESSSGSPLQTANVAYSPTCFSGPDSGAWGQL